MNRNWVYSLFALWIVCSFACTQPKPVANVEVQKENFVFSIKGTDTLSLDKYELPSISPASKKPVMIFAFGGGFKGGDKADKGYIPYFEFLARNGFVVVSTDYRTTLKNLDPSKVSSPMDFIAALQHAIDTAVEDFYDATGFVINQSSDWNIDVEQIVASGSSAGAITVLQAEYDLCNGHELAKRLPAGFNYAGVISYAGAVSGVLPPHWEKMPCPIMLFHGDADKTVPFEQAAMENLGGLWGSSAVAKSLENLQASYYFYKVENAGHEISGLPMSRNQYDIMSFLSRQVLGDENLAITTDERVPGDTIVRKDFTVWVERQEKCEIVGMESAILYEAGFQDTVDAVIMVYAPVELRIQRAMYRDGASEEQVRARIAAQMDDEEKRRRADFTVVNDGVQLLIPQLNRIVEQLKTEKFIL